MFSSWMKEKNVEEKKSVAADVNFFMSDLCKYSTFAVILRSFWFNDWIYRGKFDRNACLSVLETLYDSVGNGIIYDICNSLQHSSNWKDSKNLIFLRPQRIVLKQQCLLSIGTNNFVTHGSVENNSKSIDFQFSLIFKSITIYFHHRILLKAVCRKKKTTKK